MIDQRMRVGSNLLSPWWLLTHTQHVPRPLDEVFEFFSNAENLEKLTPEFLGFRILTPVPIRMEAGTRIAYRLRLWGITVRWLTRIEDWDPPRSFLDVQVRGPYRQSRHRHHFQPAPDGGTIMTDRVELQMPYGPLGVLAYYLLVRRALTDIFEYRATVLERLIVPPAQTSEP
jgi:ligand-binding SRPBCC domain-containing protein